MPKAPKDPRLFQSLVELVAHLRGPEGCPWDKEQTHLTLAPYTVEETAEMVDAIESGDFTHLRGELGDVLFQVVLHAQLANEAGKFSIADVIEDLNTKMIRRHPHVFGDTKVADSISVTHNWDKIKAQEKSQRKNSPAEGLDVPKALPALQRSAKIGARTRKLQFDWTTAEQVLEKVREEVAEMEDAIEEGSDEEIVHEIGDVLFSLAQLARHLEHDPEQILRIANQRFEKRFAKMMEICQREKKDWNALTSDERENLWGKAKEETK